MKITGIDIGEYRQFKNIKFDFTYPKGHPKEGKPLDKVCFIGQSGTGKTTLLNIIWEFLNTIAQAMEPHDGPFGSLAVDQKHLPYKLSDILYQAIYKISLDNSIIEFNRGSVVDDINEDAINRAYVSNWIKNDLSPEQGLSLINVEKCGLMIRDSIAREADAFLFDQKDQPQTFSDFIKTDTQIEKEKLTRDERINAAGSKKVVSLGDMQSLAIWQYLLREIGIYDELTVRHITKIVQSTPKEKVTEELQKWIADDPRIELAEKCLNPILNKFFLEVDISAKGNVPIGLCTRQGVKINSSHLSTGTRQLLATSIPIYQFDTSGTVILFDEPERSLFPDIQRILIDYYTSLAPEAQFFFATHSPIIASAFEPCERFILYFDENGEVKCHTGVAPEGDDPNDILSQDFGLDELMLQPGLDAYQRYRNLYVEIKNEKDPVRQKQLVVEQAKLGDLYKF